MRGSVAALLTRVSHELAAAGIERPRLEARLLLAHALGVSQEALLARPEREVSAPNLAALLARRKAHEPIAMILGRREFWGLNFAVSRASIIPRPDSETLIEAALKEQKPRERVRFILDLGTGTGCLLLAALLEFPHAFGVGVDASVDAAALAKQNAAMHGLHKRAAFLCGNWADAIASRFDLVLVNPPYIESDTIANLAPEVAVYEPRRALDGGKDGLDGYRAFLPQLSRLLAPQGCAVLEIGRGQQNAVAALAARAGLETTALYPDLAGTVRAMVLRAAQPVKNQLALRAEASNE